MIKIFYDLETTGTDVKKHSIHQMSYIVEIGDEEVERFSFNVQPNPKALIEPAALSICRVSEDQIKAYPPMGKGYKLLLNKLNKYINKYDKNSKAWLVGFNNCSFDNDFLKAWFEQNLDTFMYSYFYPDSRDVMVLASEYLEKRRKNMPSFKLKRVAKELGIEIIEEKLHNSDYDVELTREIYKIVTGREIEI